MTSRTFVLPDLGEGLTEGEIIQWLVAVGDSIAIDQPIAEVETAKSLVEVPSPFAGVVETLHAEPGATLPVGQPLITVNTAADAAVPPSGAPASSPAASLVAAREGEAYREEEKAGSGNVLIGFGTSGKEGGGRRRKPRGAAGSDRLSEADADAAEADWRDRRPPLVVSPIVRKLARDNGIDVSRMQGTGPGGLITRADVRAAIDHAPFAHGDRRAGADLLPPDTSRASRISAQRLPTQPQTQPNDQPTARAGASSAASDALSKAVNAAGTQGDFGVERRTRVGQFRKTVIAALTTSRQSVPEATVWCDVDATALMQLRASLPDGPGLLAYLARFTTAGLARYPVFNGRFDDDANEIVEFERINLSLAAQTDRGLITPAVLGAEGLTTRQLDERIRDLTARARDGRASTDELTKGTFTLNNYGSFRVDGSTPIINHPQVAILGFGRILQRPWVVEGQIVPRHICTMVFAFDHRVADGGAASGFMRAVADAVENPGSAIADL